ncbi:flagellar basal-body MS-ring/collar protein FliF [Buchnera aphidicola]|uniref:flagellar basal-body MS-ring/collar protein FliF n=1 Tax=Buchnera aphidicola TaxID=9 RepID=UPI003464A365
MNFEKNVNTNDKSKEKGIFNYFFYKLSITSKILIILIILIVIFFYVTSVWVKSEKYSVLYNRLSNRDRGAVISQLVTMNIPYIFNENSGLLSVPHDKVQEIRFYLSEHGLPKGSGIGFEILDKEKFGMSQFNEQINYQRALEGELARTIERLDLIKSARVHIALPKSSLFIHEKKEPTASIILDLQSGQHLDRRQINAILHFISSSVSGLTPNHVTIVDQSGNLLNNLDFVDNEVNDMKLRYSEELEKRYKKRIEDILSPVVGSENIYAQVTAQIDFDNQEKTEEKYKPNFNSSNQAIRSHQSTHNIDYTGKDSDILISNSPVNESLDVSENKINAIRSEKLLNSGKKQDMYLKNHGNENKKFYFPENAKKYRDDIVNYELDHTILRTKVNIGEIKRLSTAVVVNFIKNKQGKYVPLPIDLMKKIEYLTRQAIGYSKKRGDTVNVVNSLFMNKSDISKMSDKIKFNINKCDLVKKIDTKNIHDLNKKEDEIKFDLIWKKLTESNLLITAYPFVILFLSGIILLELIVFKRKINKLKYLHVNFLDKRKQKVESKINKQDKGSFSEDNDIMNVSNVKKTIGNLSRNEENIIEMIVKKWISDKKL